MKKTDHILIKEKNLKRAEEKLKKLGCVVEMRVFDNIRDSF
jgi:hypothetical protein